MTEEELQKRVTYIFGDDDLAARWMRLPKRSFGNRTPQETLRVPGGIEMIQEWLHNMEQGTLY